MLTSVTIQMVAVHITAPTWKEAMSVPAPMGLFWILMVEAVKLRVSH